MIVLLVISEEQEKRLYTAAKSVREEVVGMVWLTTQ